MTSGHVAVVCARAEYAAYCVGRAIARPTRYRLSVGAWEIQRLTSACEKALTGRPRNPRTGRRDA